MNEDLFQITIANPQVEVDAPEGVTITVTKCVGLVTREEAAVLRDALSRWLNDGGALGDDD